MIRLIWYGNLSNIHVDMCFRDLFFDVNSMVMPVR